MIDVYIVKEFAQFSYNSQLKENLQYFKNIVPFSFGLSGFWWKIYCHLNCFSPKVSLLSRCFQDIFFTFIFQKFNYIMSLWNSSVLSILGFTQPLEYVGLYVFGQIFEIFSYYFFAYFFGLTVSFLFFLEHWWYKW